MAAEVAIGGGGVLDATQTLSAAEIDLLLRTPASDIFTGALFMPLLDVLRSLTAEDKILQASRLIGLLRESIKLCSDDKASRLTALLNDAGEGGARWDDLAAKHDAAMRLYAEIVNDDGWELVKESMGVTVRYRHEANAVGHSIKLDGVVNADPLFVLACFYEVELFNKWVPTLKDATLLHTPSKYCKLVQLYFSLLFPVSDRDMILLGQGIDALENDAILVTMKSVNEYPGYGTVPEPGKYVRMEALFAGVIITPLTRKSCRLRIVFNVDPKLPYVPITLINWVTKQICPLVFAHLRSTCTKIAPGTPHCERMLENREVYGDIARRLDAYYARAEARASRSRSREADEDDMPTAGAKEAGLDARVVAPAMGLDEEERAALAELVARWNVVGTRDVDLEGLDERAERTTSRVAAAIGTGVKAGNADRRGRAAAADDDDVWSSDEEMGSDAYRSADEG